MDNDVIKIFLEKQPSDVLVLDASFCVGLHRWLYFLNHYKPKKIIVPKSIFLERQLLNMDSLATLYHMKNGEDIGQYMMDLQSKTHPICRIFAEDFDNIQHLLQDLEKLGIAKVVDQNDWPVSENDNKSSYLYSSLSAEISGLALHKIKNYHYSSNTDILAGVLTQRQNLVTFTDSMRVLFNTIFTPLRDDLQTIPFPSDFSSGYSNYIDMIYSGELPKSSQRLSYKNTSFFPTVFWPGLTGITGLGSAISSAIAGDFSVLNGIATAAGIKEIYTFIDNLKTFFNNYSFNYSYAQLVNKYNNSNIQYLEEAADYLGLGPISRDQAIYNQWMASDQFPDETKEKITEFFKKTK